MATRPLSAAEAEIVAGLDPEFQPVAMKHRAAALAEGLPFEFISGFRSRSQQAAEAAATDRTTPAAPAGMSKHEVGFAYDIRKLGLTPAQLERIGLIGEGLGLRWGGRFKPTPDPNHYEAPQPRVTLSAYRSVKIGFGVALLAVGAITVVGGEG
jgi:hypothetical protein